MRYKITKKFLIFWCLFAGIEAVIGSIGMFIDPSGKLMMMDTMLPYFSVLPFSEILFQNYIFSGIALLIVNGISNLIAAYLIIKNKKIGIILGTIFGFTLMLWIIIQFIIFPPNALSITYFIIGIIQLITGYMTYVFYNQEKFVFNLNDYNNIGNNNKIIVVFFSRMGYTKKIAYEAANKIGVEAEIIDIKSKAKGWKKYAIIAGCAAVGGVIGAVAGTKLSSKFGLQGKCKLPNPSKILNAARSGLSKVKSGASKIISKTKQVISKGKKYKSTIKKVMKRVATEGAKAELKVQFKVK